jgi:AcrR family transcriptional regulator
MAAGAETKIVAAARLDANAWIEAALDELAVAGIDGVRVERLAKRLAVTKGSFYWHFKDRDALHREMLAQWRRQATLALIERLDRGLASPEARLRRLLRLPMHGKRSARAADVELAVRLWGRRDPRAEAALAEVDQLRLRYIAGLLADCGVPIDAANARAVLAYCYMRVAATLLPADAIATLRQCEDMLITPTR